MKLTLCVSLILILAFMFVLRRTGKPLLFNVIRMMQSEGAYKSICPVTTRTPRPYLIPRDDKLDGLENSQLFDIYWTYANTIQFLCMNQTRVGGITDGGKEVCIDEIFKPRQPCIIYSFGSNNKFDFENAAAAKFKCEIHTFDPSRGNKNWTIPASVKFHDVGVRGAAEADYKGTDMKTLLGIMKDLKHEQATIDVLKIDVEGWEWKALPEMIESGSLKNVKQMCIEFHFSLNNGKMLYMHQLRILRQLYDHGFRLFMHDRNPVLIIDNKTPLFELSMINMNWTKIDMFHKAAIREID